MIPFNRSIRIHFIFCIVLSFFLSFFSTFHSFAQSTKVNKSKNKEPEKYATLIYVHGVMNQDYTAVHNNAKKLYSTFKDKKIGRYVIKDYRVVYWGSLARNNPAFIAQNEAIDDINYKHNEKISIAGTLNPLNLLVQNSKSIKQDSETYKNINNNFHRKLSLYNKGSDYSAQSIRYFAQNFSYDLAWMLNGSDIVGDYIDGVEMKANGINNNLESIYNKIDAQIDSAKYHTYIIVAHSAGTVASLKYVVDKLLSDELTIEDIKPDELKQNNETENKEKKVKFKKYNIAKNISKNRKEFAGLITLGSPISTFMATDLDIAYAKYSYKSKPEYKEQSLFNFFYNEPYIHQVKDSNNKIVKIDNVGRFWINIAHRNDPIASGLSPRYTEMNPDNPTSFGFIDSIYSKANFKEKVWDRFNLLKTSDSSFMRAHQWYFSHWDEIYDIVSKRVKKHEEKLNKIRKESI